MKAQKTMFTVWNEPDLKIQIGNNLGLVELRIFTISNDPEKPGQLTKKPTTYNINYESALKHLYCVLKDVPTGVVKGFDALIEQEKLWQKKVSQIAQRIEDAVSAAKRD